MPEVCPAAIGQALTQSWAGSDRQGPWRHSQRELDPRKDDIHLRNAIDEY
jgi:hypothetical protein